jgi:hypothetical protein
MRAEYLCGAPDTKVTVSRVEPCPGNRRMDPKLPIFSTLSYRYVLAMDYSYAAELFAIIVWSRCGAPRGTRAAARRAGRRFLDKGHRTNRCSEGAAGGSSGRSSALSARPLRPQCVLHTTRLARLASHGPRAAARARARAEPWTPWGLRACQARRRHADGTLHAGGRAPSRLAFPPMDAPFTPPSLSLCQARCGEWSLLGSVRGAGRRAPRGTGWAGAGGARMCVSGSISLFLPNGHEKG